MADPDQKSSGGKERTINIALLFVWALIIGWVYDNV
jgi:hypothetical protein